MSSGSAKFTAPWTVTCPICSRAVPESTINEHIDGGCTDGKTSGSSKSQATSKKAPASSPLASIFTKGGSSSGRQGPSNSQVAETLGFSSSSKKRQSDASGPSITSSPRVSKRAKTTTSNLESAQPLAERLRPRSLEEFVGQPHLTGPNSLLMNLLSSGGNMGSIIFWGPPGCGKTTLARLLARRTNAVFKELSATIVGVNEVRQVFEEAKALLTLTGRKTILFLDEVHRFNRPQQDIFLPYVEQGHIQLIGATTENPSFKVNGALLSRCRVFVLERLTDDNIKEIITRAIERVSADKDSEAKDSIDLSDESHPTPPNSSQASSSTLPSSPTSLPFPSYPHITEQVFASLVSLSNGDARTALSLLSLALSSPSSTPTHILLESLRKSVIAGYDRTGDDHYDLISALHKSVRGSDGSAALYWLARMLAGGEDPLYVCRRMVVCASEDIGLADSHALPLAMATYQACQVIGMPECRINLAHLVSYLAEAPKSTRSYEAYNRAEAAAKLDMTLPVPMQIRNAPTRLMKELGYSEGYKYNPDYLHPVLNQYLPSRFQGEVFLRKEGDVSGKIWDEEALKNWERDRNDGRDWEGRETTNPRTKQ